MTWEPQLDIGEWGRLQIVINDLDVTFFRDVPCEIQSWSSGDPFDDAAAVIRFPQVSPFEKHGTGDLSWLQGHANVEINRIDYSSITNRIRPLWEGMIASIEDEVSDTGAWVSIQCIGALYQLDYYIRPPQHLTEDKKRLYETAITDEFSPPNSDRVALRLGRCRIIYPEGMASTDWYTRYSGSWEPVLTGYIQRLLADMVHNPGYVRDPGSPEIPGISGTNAVQEVVLAPEPPPWPWGSSYPSATLNGTFRLQHRNVRTRALPWNASAADVKSALEAIDPIDEVTVTGNGTAGSPWRVTFVGAKTRARRQPRMALIHDNLRHDHSVTRVSIATQGEEGIAGQAAVPPSAPEAWDGAWTLLKDPGRRPRLQIRDESSVSWNVSVGAPGVVHNLTSDYSQAPNVFFGEGTDESATTWRNSTVEVLSDGETTTHHYPIAWSESTYPARKDLSEAGEPTEPPPLAYHEENIRIEHIQKYGAGVSLIDARRSADQQMIREQEPGWFGTVTLTTDPEEGSRFDIKAGTNLRLKHFRKLSPPQREIYDEIYDRGIFTRTDASNPLDRGPFALALWRTLNDAGFPVPPAQGSNHFPDVPDSYPWSDQINALYEVGIAPGFSSGLYEPQQEVRRDSMAAMILYAVEWAMPGTLKEPEFNHFNDYMASEVLRDQVNQAIENDLAVMHPNQAFYPEQSATRLEVGESLYLLNQYLGGGMLDDAIGLWVHIAEAQVDFDSGSVTLTVDSKARDLATLADLIERVKSENKNPAKMLMVNRESANTDDTKFPWDYEAGSGSIPTRARTPRHGALPKGRPDVNEDWFVRVPGGNHDPYKRWQIIPVVAAGKGSVSRSEVRAFDFYGRPLAIPFHVGVYNTYITAHDMPRLPFQEDAFKPPDVTGEALTGAPRGAVVLWGQQGQRAGYWPGLESEGDPVTGVLIDEGTWQFQIDEAVGDPNVLWVAIYAESNAYFQGRFYHGVQ